MVLAALGAWYCVPQCNKAEFSDIEVVAINSSYDLDYMMYMLKYDSVHGRFDAKLEVNNGHLLVNGKKIHITAERDPANIDWTASATDIVVESTGAFLTAGKLSATY